MEAAKQGNVDVGRMLLQYGASCNQLNQVQWVLYSYHYTYWVGFVTLYSYYYLGFIISYLYKYWVLLLIISINIGFYS